METIGQRLARLRKEKGLSQARLAELAGYSGQGAIGNIERGTRGYGASVVAVAKILGTTPEYLQTGVGPMRPASGLESLAAPTLAQALEVVASSLNELPGEAREAIAQHLQTLARAPDSAKAIGVAPARYCILAGIDSPLMPEAQDLMGQYSEHVLTWENPVQMNHLMDMLGKATGKPGVSMPMPH